MATIINTNPPERTVYADDSGAGVILGIILAIIILILFFLFGLPYLRSVQNSNSGTPSSETQPGINVQVNPGNPLVVPGNNGGDYTPGNGNSPRTSP